MGVIIPTDRPAVNVVDLGISNIGSILRMIGAIGASGIVAQTANQLVPGAPTILPGVGHFSAGAKALDRGRFREELRQRHDAGQALLGICLGAQLMCDESEEGPGAGLRLVPNTVRRFPSYAADGTSVRVPHVGWRAFAPPIGTLAFSPPPARMYFTHSYFIAVRAPTEVTPCTAEYGGQVFATVVAIGRGIGVQFHPEKSHRWGSAFLRAWLSWAVRVDR